MSKKYIKKGAGGMISPHDVMRERLMSRPQPGTPPTPPAGYEVVPPMPPAPRELPKLLPEVIGPRSVMGPEAPMPPARGGGMSPKTAGAAGVGALLLEYLLNEDTKPLATDSDSSYPAMDPFAGESEPETNVSIAPDFATQARGALKTFKKRGSQPKMQTSPEVPVPAPVSKTPGSSVADPRVDMRMKERRAAEKEMGMPAGDESPLERYKRRYRERFGQ